MRLALGLAAVACAFVLLASPAIVAGDEGDLVIDITPVAPVKHNTAVKIYCTVCVMQDDGECDKEAAEGNRVEWVCQNDDCAERGGKVEDADTPVGETGGSFTTFTAGDSDTFDIEACARAPNAVGGEECAVVTVVVEARDAAIRVDDGNKQVANPNKALEPFVVSTIDKDDGADLPTRGTQWTVLSGDVRLLSCDPSRSGVNDDECSAMSSDAGTVVMDAESGNESSRVLVCPEGEPRDDDCATLEISVVDCEALSDCEACLTAGPCGYCLGDGACREGSLEAPSDGSCSGSDWAWGPNTGAAGCATGGGFAAIGAILVVAALGGGGGYAYSNYKAREARGEDVKGTLGAKVGGLVGGALTKVKGLRRGGASRPESPTTSEPLLPTSTTTSEASEPAPEPSASAEDAVPQTPREDVPETPREDPPSGESAGAPEVESPPEPSPPSEE